MSGRADSENRHTAARPPAEVVFTEDEVEPVIGRPPREVVFGEGEAETVTAPRPPPSTVPAPDVLASPGGGAPPAPYAGVLDPPGAPARLFARPPVRRTRPRARPNAPPPGPSSPPGSVPPPMRPGSYETILDRPVSARGDRIGELAAEVARLVGLGQPGYHALLWHLERAGLDRSGIADLMARLDARDALQPFLRLARRGRLWEYLRDRGVDWRFVFDHYRLGPADAVDFMAGMAAGVGANAAETLVLPLELVEGLYVLTGSAFDAGLAARRDEFFAAMRRLLASPVVAATAAGQQWWRRLDGHLGQLRLFEAGVMIGEVLPDVVAAIKGAAKGAVKAHDLVAAAGRRLAATAPVLTGEIAASLMTRGELDDVIQALGRGERHWTSPTGLRLERSAADESVLRGGGGDVLARLDDTAIDEFIGALDRFAGTSGKGGLPISSVSLNLPALADRVVAEMPQGSLTSQDWGRKLHVRAAELLRADPALTGWVIVADVKFRSVFDLGEIADMTVGEFYRRFAGILPEGLPRDKKTLQTVIGDKKPDLAAYNPATGQAIVADLTTMKQVKRQQHVRKTYLDMEILKVAVEKGYAKGIGFGTWGDYGH